VPRFTARSLIDAPAAAVFAFHERDGAFERLSPPFEAARVVRRTGSIRDGDEAVLEVRQGPVRLRWTAEHRDYVPGRQFVDVQRNGPFAAWEHTHRVEPQGEGRSWMHDEIEYRLPFGSLGQALGGWLIRGKLEQMFAYRHAVLAHDQAVHAKAAGRRLTVAITGASGMVGQNLTALLTSGGHTVRPIGRAKRGRAPKPGQIVWDPAAGTIDAAALEGVDAVIHLAGEYIGQRWSAAAKARILESRTKGTRLIAEAMAGLQKKPEVLVSMSGAAIYGDRPGEHLDDDSAVGDPDDSFLGGVVHAWEAAADPARAAGIRVVHPRMGIVLTPAGGALQKMLPAFLAGVGGPVGSGRQGFTWIGVDDAIGGLAWMLFDETLEGPVNLTAPEPVVFEDFARALGRVLRRPAIVPLPAFVVSALFGQMGRETLLGGVLLRPSRLEAAGYPFLHRDVEPALRHVLGRYLEHPGRHGEASLPGDTVSATA
jgi:uncharacterized protein (TIGR01777 family)